MTNRSPLDNPRSLVDRDVVVSSQIGEFISRRAS